MTTNPSQVQLRWPAEFNVLPKEVFHREDIYRLELERIFYGPEWHLMAHISEVPEPGDFKTLNLGEAPLLILRGDDGLVRVFNNSCPHRGTQLETHSRGNVPDITCPYHRWNFNNRGELLGAPGIERFPDGFRKEDFGMRELRSEIRHGLVFTTCSAEAPSLASFLGEDGDAFLSKLLGGGAALTLLGYQKVVFATNWKEYGDNEGYHAPLLHRAFRLLRWQGRQGRPMRHQAGPQADRGRAQGLRQRWLPGRQLAGGVPGPECVARFDRGEPFPDDGADQASRRYQHPLRLSALARRDRIALRLFRPCRRRPADAPPPGFASPRTCWDRAA